MQITTAPPSQFIYLDAILVLVSCVQLKAMTAIACEQFELNARS